jgi:PKD domain
MCRWILTRGGLTIALAFVASLVATSGAQAVVVDMSAVGQTSVAYNSADTGDYTGVAMVPAACPDLWYNNTCAALASHNIPTVTSSAPCTDPSLAPDLATFGGPNQLPNDALCYHGGSVQANSETFALTWDTPWPDGTEHNYWEDTRDYVEQFLRDVADGSATDALTSPYGVTGQYTDAAHNHAGQSVKYGGGCIDYGSVGGSSCDFGTDSPTGHDYGASGCTPSGASYIDTTDSIPNGECLTDAQIKSEISTMVSQEGIIGHTQPGYTPTVVLLTPPGVDTCLDAAGTLCSANSSLNPPAPQVSNDPENEANATSPGSILAGTYRVEITYVSSGGGESLPSDSAATTTTGNTSKIFVQSPPSALGVTGYNVYMTANNGSVFYLQNSTPEPIGDTYTQSDPPTSGAQPPANLAFCSYHSQVDVDGTTVSYVVQPWTPMTSCDEPQASDPGESPPVNVLETNFGSRLVSPLSQSQIPALTDPSFGGWIAEDGAEMNDNGGCVVSQDSGIDSVTVGSSSQNPYLLQREFNNASVMSSDPNTYGCAPNVFLDPEFVVPSAVDAGDVVEFDGSATESTLIVPKAGYVWNFGDGTSGTGPSVEHSYSYGGTYNVTLTVTDRGGNVNTLTQAVTVLGPNGQPVPPTPTPSNGTPSNQGSVKGLRVALALLPQSLRSMLKSGVLVSVSSNQAANGYATVSITKATAKQAHIKTGRGPSVTIGIGTLSNVKSGVQRLHLHLSKAMAKKLSRLKRVNLTVRLVLVSRNGGAVAIDAAGHY